MITGKGASWGNAPQTPGHPRRHGRSSGIFGFIRRVLRDWRDSGSCRRDAQ